MEKLILIIQGSPLRILSENNINMAVFNGSSLTIGNSSLNISTDTLSFLGLNASSTLLSVSNTGVRVGASQLEVTGSLGLTLNGPVQTSQLQSPANQNLQINSLSGQLELTGAQGVHIRDGPASSGIRLTSHNDFTLESQTGQVRNQRLNYWGLQA